MKTCIWCAAFWTKCSVVRTSSLISHSKRRKCRLVKPISSRCVTTLFGMDGMRKLLMTNRLFYPGDSLRYKLYFDDYPVQEISHMWMDTQGATDKDYVVQTSTKVVERCLLMTTDPGDLVLDPTCGSGTTAYVAEQWGRRWITCDTSRVALALARTRLMAAKYPYYLLMDSPEGRKKQAELTGTPPHPNAPSPHRDRPKGIVYRTAPHPTLNDSAHNPAI